MKDGKFYRFARCVVRFLVRLVYRIKVEGLENVPQEEGFILCANHTKLLDPILAAMDIKPQVYFMAKAELFKNRFLAAVFKGLGAFPVERGKGDTTAIETAEEILRGKKVLGIFPEGTRSKTGVPLRPKSGAAMLAGKMKADVLPVGISIRPKLRIFCTITVRYGKLIRNEELGLEEMAPGAIKLASKKIMGEIVALLEPLEKAWE